MPIQILVGKDLENGMKWKKTNESEQGWRFGILETHYKSCEAIFGDLFSTSVLCQHHGALSSRQYTLWS